jgi:cytochrome c peroxidase
MNYPSLAAKGYDIFTDKGCASCHQVNQSYALLTDGLFHNTGVGYLTKKRPARPERIQISPGVFIVPEVDAETETFSDEGRYEVTGQTSDRWRYRTPSLRNVALTGPYMHDGSIPTLEGVLAFYGDGGGADPTRDARIKNLRLSQREQAALLAFLRTLTSDHVDKLVSDARSTAIGERLADRTEDMRSNER